MISRAENDFTFRSFSTIKIVPVCIFCDKKLLFSKVLLIHKPVNISNLLFFRKKIIWLWYQTQKLKRKYCFSQVCSRQHFQKLNTFSNFPWIFKITAKCYLKFTFYKIKPLGNESNFGIWIPKLINSSLLIYIIIYYKIWLFYV